MTKLILRSLAVALLLVAAAVPAPAQQFGRESLRSSTPILAAFRDVIAGPSKSVVRVQVDGKDVSLGTVVAADGYVLTRGSDLHGKVSCKFRDGKTLDAKVVGVDEAHDLAMLEVDAKD